MAIAIVNSGGLKLWGAPDKSVIFIKQLLLFFKGDSQWICAHLGITYGHRIEKYITETSRGNRIYAKAGKLHFFKRNSLALKDAWRGVISPQEEAVIQEVVGDDIHLLYDQW